MNFPSSHIKREGVTDIILENFCLQPQVNVLLPTRVTAKQWISKQSNEATIRITSQCSSLATKKDWNYYTIHLWSKGRKYMQWYTCRKYRRSLSHTLTVRHCIRPNITIKLWDQRLQQSVFHDPITLQYPSKMLRISTWSLCGFL